MKDWNEDTPVDERRQTEERMREAARRALQRVPNAEEVERRRLEKIALFPLRYGASKEKIAEMLDAIPAPVVQRPPRWLRQYANALGLIGVIAAVVYLCEQCRR